MSLAVEMNNITKAFSGVKAIEEVSLAVEKGEIHALVGENGAGKSTLMNVLSGTFPSSSYEGTVKVNSREVKCMTPNDANRQGIVMVHQELALIAEISVAENVFLGHLPTKNKAVDWQGMYRGAEELLERLSLDIDVKTKIKYLSVGQQQLVEIAKAIQMGGQVLILDEPTAPLTDREIDILFRILRSLKEQGLTILYISHRMEEIFKLTDRVSVMRDGRMIATKKTAEVSAQELVSYMIGREMKNMYPALETVPGEVILRIDNYSVPHPDYPGKMIVDDITMEFKKGEITGISGLLGAGRTELMMAVAGSYRTRGSGRVRINGKEVRLQNPRQAIDAGIGFVTEDRKGNGLVMNHSLSFNCTLAALSRIQRKRMLNRQAETELAEKFVSELKIKTNDIKLPVKSLSGGNQQKVVLGKWLATNPRILILDEPTRGVDVGAKYEIYMIMKELAKAGVSVIMISSDLPEVIGMSDRVYVMREGRLAGELPRTKLSEENIMGYATGSVQA